jgi:hypothetical protein
LSSASLQRQAFRATAKQTQTWVDATQRDGRHTDRQQGSRRSMACFQQARSAAGFIWREAIGPKPPWAMRTTKRVYPCGLWGGGGAGVADTEHVGRTWGERVRRGGGRRESRAWRELGMVKVNRSTGPCRRPSSIHTSTQPLLAYRRSCFPHRRATVPGRRSPRSPRHFSRDPACRRPVRSPRPQGVMTTRFPQGLRHAAGTGRARAR